MNTTPPAPGAPPQRWWDRINFWRISTAAAMLLAAVLAVKPWAPVTAPQLMRYVAVLQSTEKTDSSWIVEATPGGMVRLTPLFTTQVPPQKALQFWSRVKGASGPTSLGLVTPDRVTVVDAAHLPVLEREQSFELTLEPESGSSSGRPTGPVMFVGRAAALKPR